MKKFDLIIWDLDGTLIDSDLYIVQNYLNLYKKYMPNYVPSVRKIISFSGPTVMDVIKKEFKDYPYEDVLKDFLEFSSKYEKSLLSLFPNEIECLKEIKSKGIKQCILTNKRRTPAQNDVKNFKELNDCIDFLITAEDVKNPKPDIEGVQKCIKLSKAKKNRIIIIGDSSSDIQTGINAGIKTGYVTWSLKKEEMLIQSDYTFNTFEEIKEEIVNGRED